MKKIGLIFVVIVIICVSIFGIFQYYEAVKADRELLKIYFFNVGNADCTLITNQGEAMLIDGGNEADSDLLIKYMKSIGVNELKYVIATHDDQDHIAGLDKIINAMKIDTVYMPNTDKNSNDVNNLLKAVNNQNKEIEIPDMDTTYYLGDANWQVKWVGDATKDGVTSNQSSIVIEMDHGIKKYLFMSDYEPIKEDNPQYKKIKWNPVNVLKVAHHGSKTNLIEGFFGIVKPDYAIISAGNNEKREFPDKEVTNALELIQKEKPIEILVTRFENKTIIVISDGNNIRIEKDNKIVDGN